ncbi:hypothetical protein [Herbiconiux sp. UC225_62]|uniref:hypothetical protein n=1 Tax=Herbiconiux sp. UC225_62 TaxID=3350168 RepID=UPI0036D232C5
MSPHELEAQARRALLDVGVITQEAIELVAIHPERFEQIMATALQAIQRRNGETNV